MSQDTHASGLAGRYAVALLELAEDKKAVDKVEKDLAALKEMIDGSMELYDTLRSPMLSSDEGAGVVAKLAKKAKFNALTANFLGVVARNGRLFALPGIISAFTAELAHRRGEMVAEVKAATKLSKKQEKDLADAIKKAVGSKVQIDLTVDPSLLGGLVVKVGSRLIDSSLATRMTKLKHSMKAFS
ncbi:MAG: F0F1 ATP synthase subunit delta [Alphaproteobacteria bacterium]